MATRWWWSLGALALAACGGGGSDDDGPAAAAGTYPARAAPLGPPPFLCGVPGPGTLDVMADMNWFWQSSVVACACELDAYAIGCQGNGFVSAPGYIYYDRHFLNGLDAVAGRLPADFFLAHEFGHTIQLALRLPSSGGKFKELQADCLGGYYLGSRIRRGLATATDVQNTFGFACSIGDPFASPWWVAGAHGTCSERNAALQAGINGHLAGLRPGEACPSA